MSKTPQQDAQDRKAAKLRKQRGRNGVKIKTEVAPSLADIAVEQRKRARFMADIDREFDNALSAIEKTGAGVVANNGLLEEKVVTRLKNHFRNTKIKWKTEDGKTFFAKG